MKGSNRSDWLRLLLDADPINEYRTVSEHHHRGGLIGRLTSFTSMLVVGFVVVSAAIGISASRPAANAERLQLQTRVIAAKAAALSAETSYLQARRGLDDAEAALAAALDGALAAELQFQSLLSGYAAVSGPGLVLTLNNSERPKQHENVDLGLVIDRDLQHAVNGLWRAGAEAISINGRRLSARTPIRNAGNAILVDYRPLTPPYAIRAIGNAKQMQQRLESTPEWQELNALRDRYGLRWNVVRATNLSLAAATSSFPRLAQPGGN